MFASNPSTLAHICQSIRYNLVSVLLISCFAKVRYLSYDFKSTHGPKSNPIHTISQIVPHFHSISTPFPLHIHFHMDFHSTEGLYYPAKKTACRSNARFKRYKLLKSVTVGPGGVGSGRVGPGRAGPLNVKNYRLLTMSSLSLRPLS